MMRRLTYAKRTVMAPQRRVRDIPQCWPSRRSRRQSKVRLGGDGYGRVPGRYRQSTDSRFESCETVGVHALRVPPRSSKKLCPRVPDVRHPVRLDRLDLLELRISRNGQCHEASFAASELPLRQPAEALEVELFFYALLQVVLVPTSRRSAAAEPSDGSSPTGTLRYPVSRDPAHSARATRRTQWVFTG